MDNKTEALLYYTLATSLLLSTVSILVIPQMEYRAVITLVLMISGLILIIGKRKEHKNE